MYDPIPTQAASFLSFFRPPGRPSAGSLRSAGPLPAGRLRRGAEHAAPFCNVAGCVHTGPDCAAGAVPCIATDGSRLLYFSWEDGRSLSVSAAGLDGGRRFRLCTFGPDEDISMSFAADDRSLYYLVATRPEHHAPNRLVPERFDLPTLTRTELCVLNEDLSNGTSFFLDAACGDSMILESYDKQGNIGLWRYDPAGGSITLLMEGAEDKSLLAAYEDWLFRFDVGEDGETIRLHAENWQDGRSFEMPGCFISATGYPGVHPVGFYHDTLFVSTVAALDEAAGDLVIRQYAVNCETKSLRETTHLDPVTRRPLPVIGGYTTPDGQQMLTTEVYEFSGSDMESCTGSHYVPMLLEEYLF